MVIPDQIGFGKSSKPERRRAQAAIPQARLVAIEEAGHLPQVEAFDRYWRALEEFLGPP